MTKPVMDELVERAAKAFADAAGYYVPFHRGLSSPSADKLRAGIRAALSTLPADEGQCSLGEMHGCASTFTNANGVRCCDFCGRPASLPADEGLREALERISLVAVHGNQDYAIESELRQAMSQIYDIADAALSTLPSDEGPYLYRYEDHDDLFLRVNGHEISLAHLSDVEQSLLLADPALSSAPPSDGGRV